MKLGKLAPKFDPRTLKFARYLQATPPPIPAAVDWLLQTISHLSDTSWLMMGNDTVGDCTCAAMGHMCMEWTSEATGSPAALTDADILAAYSQISGYTPGDPSTDVGATCLDALNLWRHTGLSPATPDTPHQIVAYVQVDPKNADEVKRAIQLFGAVYVGISLPATAQSQLDPVPTPDPARPSNLTGYAVWDVVGNPMLDPGAAPGSWGGHAVPIGAYDADMLTCVTWGYLKEMSWAFFATYADECYAAISRDWIDVHGLDPAGLNLDQLAADLHAIDNPPFEPPAPPSPDNPPAPPVPPEPAPPAPPSPSPDNPPAPVPDPSKEESLLHKAEDLVEEVIEDLRGEGK